MIAWLAMMVAISAPCELGSATLRCPTNGSTRTMFRPMRLEFALQLLREHVAHLARGLCHIHISMNTLQRITSAQAVVAGNRQYPT
jgi:hypothetical protein